VEQQPTSISGHIPEDELLIEWIETEPTCSDLVCQAKGEQSRSYFLRQVGYAIRYVLSFVVADASEFHGKNFVTRELKEHSQLTARWVSGASLLNAITNQPLLYFALKDFGNPGAWIFSLTLNLIILKFTNDGGTAVAGRKINNRLWASAGVFGLVLMSFLQSFVAAIGCELMNNGSNLSQLKAEELIRFQEDKVQALQPDLENYKKVEAKRVQLQQELKQLDRSDPRWDSVYVRLYGPYAERKRDWSQVPEENLPLDQQAQRLLTKASQQTDATRDQWKKVKAKQIELGNDILFLKQELPALYSLHFDATGELRSGVDAVRLATLNFFDKFAKGDFAGLGFPLFFLCLSMITSAGACLMTIAHAQREDTQMSRDETVGEAISGWLEDIRRDHLNRRLG
jgi:hypothetical protein